MWLFVCSAFVLLSSVKGFSMPAFSVSPAIADTECHQDETSCGNSCCPYPNAICCNETQTCCRQGSVCLGSISYCLGLKQNGEAPTLYSEKSTALRVEACPSGTTSCSGGCCPLPNAVCCPGGLTCCPEGTVCDNTGICLGGESVATRFLKAVLSKSINVPSTNNVDGCPSGTTSCSGGCCPLPNAVCCPDGLTCCPEGSVCDPSGSGFCFKGGNVAARFLKAVRSKSFNVPSIDNVSDCPSGTTTCSGGCCPLPDAVCCPDGLTCCPEGSVCDPSGSGFCFKGGISAARFLKVVSSKSFNVPSTYNAYNFPMKRYPFIPKAGDDCCEAWFGYICCTYPFVCTTLGCM